MKTRPDNTNPRAILLLSFDGEDGFFGARAQERTNASLTRVDSLDHARRELEMHRYDVFVSRCQEFDDSQFEMLEFVKNRHPGIPVVLAPKTGSVENAVRAIKMGASDVLVRESIDEEFFEEILRNARPGHHPASGSDGSSDGSSGAIPEATSLIGNSPAICDVRSAIGLVARSQAAVLITGESGTGKEIVARRIHLESERNARAFVALNCAAFPKDVIENELFGHEKGAFTGALNMKNGAFELADRGTLFFDEIAEMSPEVQAKLLRAIEHKSYRRLGGKDEIHVDVRVVAATNKNISAALASGELREDLYYRFSVIEIVLPPLRERPEDIPLLVEHFLSIYSQMYGKTNQRFSGKALEMLSHFSWPGNVRELRNTVERAVVTSRQDVIDVENLPSRITQRQQAGSSVSIAIGSTCKEAERTIVLQTLAHVHNNKSKAARILGLSRKTLHNKLRQFNVQQD